jgi:hypothetical protein
MGAGVRLLGWQEREENRISLPGEPEIPSRRLLYLAGLV